MKTVEDIKKIWKKSLIETTNEVFDEVIKTASEETKKDTLDSNNSIACMSMVRDKMENTLRNNGLNDEDVSELKKHQDEWVRESMPWMMNLITDRLKIKETIIKQGGKHE